MSEQIFKAYLEQWEFGAINDEVNFKEGKSILNKDNLYDYSYLDILGIYKDRSIADKILKEIQLCSQMHFLIEDKIKCLGK